MFPRCRQFRFRLLVPLCSLSLALASCGGSSPTEPAKVSTPTPTPTPVPTATPVPTPTPVPSALEGYITPKSGGAVYGTVVVTVTQDGLSRSASSELIGSPTTGWLIHYRVDRLKAGPAQVVTTVHGCASVLFNITLHDGTNDFNFQICP